MHCGERARLLARCALLAAAFVASHAADLGLTGRVVDETEAPVGGAAITLRTAAPAARSWQSRTDPAGVFTIRGPEEGDYTVDVQREGYYELKRRPLHFLPGQEVTLVVNRVHEIFQSVDVMSQPSPVDIAETRNEERLSGTEVNDIPYSSSHSLRSSIKLMPGVLQDPTGDLHFNGSSENQVQYVLNGFDIADPISGEFRTILAVEGIHSMNYSSARYSPEFGQGSAGVLEIRTEGGSDAFHYTATDFVPGLSIQQGVRLSSWYPRFGVSGPIVKGRAWFSDTFDSEYNTSLVTGLPSGENTRSGWGGANLLHTQTNLGSRNIVFADFLVNTDNENRVGLGVLDPVSTTQTVHRRQYFGSLKDQFYLGGGSLVELGYAHDESSVGQTPQGQSLYVFSPEGRSGNYFATSNQSATRDQGRLHGYAPQLHWMGSHQIEAGADANFLSYEGFFRRTGYQLEGLSGQLLSQTSFTGAGIVHVHDAQIAPWLLDSWRISKRLELDAGIRRDWDRLVRAPGWSPRLAFSWAPFADGRTRVAGGYAVTHDAVPLDPFGRAQDQSALTTQYTADGSPVGPPVATTFALGPGPWKLPRSTNWSLSADHQISARLYASVKLLSRRGSDGFTFLNTLAPGAPPSLLPLPNGTAAGAYQLANLRRDRYEAVQIAIRQTFSGQYEWMASYTRSQARSNALIDPNSAEPLQALSNFVPLPWDSPNRFLAWAYLPLPWKYWAVSVLADARSGFPFSVQQENGLVSGAVNSYRYPLNLDLNLAIERMITLRGYRFALRGGVDNLTNQRNPTAVNNTIGAPQYLDFLGDEGRHFVARLRFFGRAETGGPSPKSERAKKEPQPFTCCTSAWQLTAAAGFGAYHPAALSAPAGNASAGIGPRYVLNASAGRQLGDHFAVEGAWTFQDGDFEIASAGAKTAFDANSHAVHGDLLYYLRSRSNRWRPYLVGGSGVRLYHGIEKPHPRPLAQFGSFRDGTDPRALFDFGGGIERNLNARWALRLDVRDYATPFPSAVIVPAPGGSVKGWLHDLVASFGVTFR